MTQNASNRRRFPRVQLRSHGQLTTAQGPCSAHLVNLSERGALIAILKPHTLAEGDAVTLHIELGDDQYAIMEGRIAHAKEHLVGLAATAASRADAKLISELVAELPDEGEPPTFWPANELKSL